MTTPSSKSEHGSSDEVAGKTDEVVDNDDVELVDDRKVEQFTQLVLARVENKLEEHHHTQMELPPADQAAALREKAPEVYRAWIDIARQKADTEAYVQKAQYEVPARLARTGRPWAAVALLMVLGFCGYIASLGGAGIYIAGIISAIDLVSMLGLFIGLRPELIVNRDREIRSKSEESGKKDLPTKDSELINPYFGNEL